MNSKGSTRGYPIWESSNLCLFPAPRSVSSVPTPFIVLECLGIHRKPFYLWPLFLCEILLFLKPQHFYIKAKNVYCQSSPPLFVCCILHLFLCSFFCFYFFVEREQAFYKKKKAKEIKNKKRLTEKRKTKKNTFFIRTNKNFKTKTNNLKNKQQKKNKEEIRDTTKKYNNWYLVSRISYLVSRISYLVSLLCYISYFVYRIFLNRKKK